MVQIIINGGEIGNFANMRKYKLKKNCNIKIESVNIVISKSENMANNPSRTR